MKEFNPDKGIQTSADFSEYCNQMLDEFLSKLTLESGLIRHIAEDDVCDDGDYFIIYTVKGVNFYERFIRRLYKVAVAHGFNDVDFDPSMYKEC